MSDDETTKRTLAEILEEAVYRGMRRALADTAPESEPMLITVTEAARRVGISRALAYELIRKQQFPFKRLGSKPRVPVKALEQWVTEDWIAAQQAAGTALPAARTRKHRPPDRTRPPLTLKDRGQKLDLDLD